jgi:hypothetical protein
MITFATPCRLLGKAKIFLESLVESKERKIHVDVKLTDGYGNPTEVSAPLENLQSRIKASRICFGKGFFTN